MKPHPSRLLAPALAAGLVVFSSLASAQRGISIPIPTKDGRGFTTREAGTSTNNKVKPAPAPKTVTIQYTAVTPLRTWMNNKGQIMTARLLAFSAPKEGETGTTEVIRDGKIRFLLVNAKKPIVYSLVNLSEADQDYVREIAEAARKGRASRIQNPESRVQNPEKRDKRQETRAEQNERE